MVIVNHTNSTIFNNFFPSVSGQASLILFFSKAAVPIFFMISGALLLGKTDTYKVAYGKRAFRITVDIIIFSVLNFIVFDGDFSSFSLDFFTDMINKPYTVSFWYLYSYLAIMLLLPIWQKLAKVMSKKDFTVFLAILFFFNSAVPFLKYLEIIPSASNYFTRNLLSGDIFYFFLGYYICHILPDILNSAAKKRAAISLSAVAFFSGIIFSWYRTAQEFYNDGKFSLNLDNVFGMHIVLPAAGLFIFVFLLFRNIKLSGWFAKLLTIVSSATFGIYLTHYIIIKMGNFLLELLKDNMNDFIAILIFDVLVFIAGVVGISILRLIPKVKNFL